MLDIGPKSRQVSLNVAAYQIALCDATPAPAERSLIHGGAGSADTYAVAPVRLRRVGVHGRIHPIVQVGAEAALRAGESYSARHPAANELYRDRLWGSRSVFHGHLAGNENRPLELIRRLAGLRTRKRRRISPWSRHRRTGWRRRRGPGRRCGLLSKQSKTQHKKQ